MEGADGDAVVGELDGYGRASDGVTFGDGERDRGGSRAKFGAVGYLAADGFEGGNAIGGDVVSEVLWLMAEGSMGTR